MKKTIKDLLVSQIKEEHLIKLKVGDVFYRKSKDDPLNFHYNQTTFTTEVPTTDKLVFGAVGSNSGASCFVESVNILEAETKSRDGRVYEIKTEKELDSILDLDKVCEEQRIEKEYLKIYPDGTYGRNPEKESELFKLYGLELSKRRIYGVRYRSRRDSSGHCIIIYDTLPNIREHFSSK